MSIYNLSNRSTSFVFNPNYEKELLEEIESLKMRLQQRELSLLVSHIAIQTMPFPHTFVKKPIHGHA